MSLRDDRRASFINGQPIVRLGGLWARQGVTITETDIAEARREMLRPSPCCAGGHRGTGSHPGCKRGRMSARLDITRRR